MRIILLGCPGAGKGTQARILSQRYDLPHIATGDLFRAEISAKSALGLRVADYLKSGTLVPDSLVVEMVAGKLETSSAGFLLDGFPRTLEQAQALDGYLRRSGQRIDLVLYLAVREEAVVERLVSRRSCAACGVLYNLLSRPSQNEGRCDQCGGALVQREDDRETTVRKRLMVYEDLTRPLIAYYHTEYAFHEVDAAQSMEHVTEQILSVIERTVVRS